MKWWAALAPGSTFLYLLVADEGNVVFD